MRIRKSTLLGVAITLYAASVIGFLYFIKAPAEKRQETKTEIAYPGISVQENFSYKYENNFNESTMQSFSDDGWKTIESYSE